MKSKIKSMTQRAISKYVHENKDINTAISEVVGKEFTPEIVQRVVELANVSLFNIMYNKTKAKDFSFDLADKDKVLSKLDSVEKKAEIILDPVDSLDAIYEIVKDCSEQDIEKIASASMTLNPESLFLGNGINISDFGYSDVVKSKLVDKELEKIAGVMLDKMKDNSSSIEANSTFLSNNASKQLKQVASITKSPMSKNPKLTKMANVISKILLTHDLDRMGPNGVRLPLEEEYEEEKRRIAENGGKILPLMKSKIVEPFININKSYSVGR